MAREIERKFLVGDRGVVTGLSGRRIVQGYLATDPVAVRVRLIDGLALVSIKGPPSSGLVRDEYEYPIPAADAEAMLARLCRAPPIEKRRYVTRYGAHVWEIDVFEGLNAPLVLAEVELTRPEESVTIPPWVGAEVTHDPRYLNAYLARHPFAHWAANERAANDRETNET